MVRPIGTSGDETLEAIREAGVRMIYERGYHAVSMRELAAAVGLQAPSLYNYFRTKQDLLFELMTSNLREMLAAVDAALHGIEGPRARLEAFIAFHLTYHTARRQKALICSTELRSLDADRRKVALALRDTYEGRLADILKTGAAAGDFQIHDLRIATMGILGMLTSATQWYRPGGRLSRAALVAEYVHLVLHGVACHAHGDETPRR